MMTIHSENVLFIGNPGVGKSTLLNTMIGKPHFKSGVNIGIGISYQLDQFKVNNINYMDTPGLKDVQMREKAAKAITEALQTDGVYHVAFVVTLESGRVKPEDAATIKVVLESAQEITKFAVIVNKLSRRLYDDITSNGVYKTQIANDLVGRNIDKMQHLFLLQKRAELDGGENSVVDLPELKEFILNTLPAIRIHMTNVKEMSNAVLSGYDKQFQIEMEITRKQIEKEQRETERIQREATEAKRRAEEKLRIERERERNRLRELERQAERRYFIEQERECERIRELERQADRERRRKDQEIREYKELIERQRQQEARARRLEQERRAREEQEEQARFEQRRRQQIKLEAEARRMEQELQKQQQQALEDQRRRYQAELQAARQRRNNQDECVIL